MTDNHCTGCCKSNYTPYDHDHDMADQLNFDNNLKLKPNILQMLNFIRQREKKVVAQLHEKTMIILNLGWCGRNNINSVSEIAEFSVFSISLMMSS